MGLVRAIAGVALAALAATASQAQTYPAKPVRVMVGFAPGSGPDVISRAISIQLAADLGQSFVIENRLGANGTIAARAVAQADPDGYTLLFSSSSIASTPFIYKHPNFDVLRDLAPIATSGVLDGYLLLVHPSLPVHGVAELIAYAKQNRVLYGSPGVGNGLHLATELFKLAAGIGVEHVPYRGASEVANALLGQNIHFMFVTPTSVLGLVKEGRLRAIGFSGAKRFPEFPEVPLVRDTVPSLSILNTWGMFYAPGKTPPAIVEKLNAAVRQALRAKLVADVVARAGYVPDGHTAAQTAEFFRKEVAATGEAVKAARIQPQ